MFSSTVYPTPGGFLQATFEGENAIVNNTINALENINKSRLICELFSGCGTITIPLLLKNFKIPDFWGFRSLAPSKIIFWEFFSKILIFFSKLYLFIKNKNIFQIVNVLMSEEPIIPALVDHCHKNIVHFKILQSNRRTDGYLAALEPL